MSDDHDMIQVVFIPELIQALDGWLDNRGLMRFRIPVGQDDSLPTYGITPKHMTSWEVKDMTSWDQ